MAYTHDEVAFLAQHWEDVAGCGLALTKKAALADAALARDHFGAYGRAALELAHAQASGKLPEGWLGDNDSTQQATPRPVAAHRARRLIDAGITRAHDVTCSIGSEGADLADSIDYLGTDLDRVRLAMARHNLPSGHFACADALAPVSLPVEDSVIIADPARRAGGRRITNPADLMPPLPDLVNAYGGREMAIKCAPGLDFSEWDGLVSLASVDGAVKEACLYTPGIAERLADLGANLGANSGAERDGHRVTREALLFTEKESGVSVDRITDADESELPDAGEPGEYIIDPDGAVVRAGLVRHYAAREGLWQLDPQIAYLTGNRIPEGRSGFPFIEQVPVKKLKGALAAHGAGRVEILVRGLDVDPDQLRKKLKLKGDRPMTVVMTRIGRHGVALICGAREWNE